MNLLQFFLVGLAGWVNRNQQYVIEYLQEEVKVLKEQLGKKPRFSDGQRRRLAAKAKKLGQEDLRRVATLVTLVPFWLGTNGSLRANTMAALSAHQAGRPRRANCGS